MKKHIDYYVSLQSPWTYLGHARLVSLAQQNGAEVTVRPVNYGEVFPATGGLPLPKRAPARQAYRMMELKRWREHLGVELNLEPDFFPVDDKLAGQLVVATRKTDAAKAVELAGRVLAAVWVEQSDITDEQVLRNLIDQCNLNADELFASIVGGDMLRDIENDTRDAIKRGVFGAPTYVVDDEIFWGQDRLEFLERKLAV